MLDSQQSLANQNFGSHISEGAYSRVVKDLSDFLGSRVRVPFAAFAWKNKKYEKSTVTQHSAQRRNSSGVRAQEVRWSDTFLALLNCF